MLTRWRYITCTLMVSLIVVLYWSASVGDAQAANGNDIRLVAATNPASWLTNGGFNDMWGSPRPFVGFNSDQANEAMRLCLVIRGSQESTLCRDLDLFAKGDPKTYEIYLLGEMRSISSVPLLVGDIDFVATVADHPGGIGAPRWGKYPAVEALIKIGILSANDVIAKLPTETDASRRKLMCDVVIGVYGKRIGGIVFQDALNSQADTTLKKNMEACTKYFEMAATTP